MELYLLFLKVNHKKSGQFVHAWERLWSDCRDINLYTWGRHLFCPLSIRYEKVDNSYSGVMVPNQFPVTKCQNDFRNKRKNNSGLIENSSLCAKSHKTFKSIYSKKSSWTISPVFFLATTTSATSIKRKVLLMCNSEQARSFIQNQLPELLVMPSWDVLLWPTSYQNCYRFRI